MQELAKGGLSQAVTLRLEELAPAELEAKKERAKVKTGGAKPKGATESRRVQDRDPRLPKPGVILSREYGGLTHEVEVLEEGFRWSGKSHSSLSAIARAITGTSWNGFLFFGLLKRTGR